MNKIEKAVAKQDKKAQRIVNKLNRLINKASDMGIMVRYQVDQLNDITFYYNDEYGTILVDKRLMVFESDFKEDFEEYQLKCMAR